MSLCFHFTKMRNMEGIGKEGLRPMIGENCAVIGDNRDAKISYSIGCENAVKMFYSLYEIYGRIDDGRVNIESFGPGYEKVVEKIQKSKSFESWEEDGVYLAFDRDSIMGGDRCDESKPHDAWSNGMVLPKDIMVCAIRDKRKFGKIVSFSKYDIVAFMASRVKERVMGFYSMHISDKIAQFSDPRYEMDFIDLETLRRMYKKQNVEVDV